MIRVLRFPVNLRILEIKQCFTNKLCVFRYSSMFCQKLLNCKDRPFQMRPDLSSSLRPTVLSCKNDSKYFSQQHVKNENFTDQSDSSSAGESSPSVSTSFDAQTVEINASESQITNQSNLFENIDYDEITGGDEEKLNKLKLLMLEIDVMQQDGMYVPSKMTKENWKDLFDLDSRNKRQKFLTFLFKNEMKKLSDKRKRERKRIARLEHLEEKDRDSSRNHIEYGFRGSTIFLRVYDNTINSFDNYRLIRAMMFGQDLIIDCGFRNDMNTMENKLCVKQIMYLFAENRYSKEPFNLHFCNLDKNSLTYSLLKKLIPTLEDPGFPINIYEGHYLDLFPKEKLVYLTPHCRTELREFNPHDIYIVGAIVDRVNTQPLSLAKAKSEGLRMAHLPLDRYLDWGLGNKSLTINQVVNIMHDLQVTGDWNIALKNVPQRKIRQPGDPVDYRRPRHRGSTFQPPQRFIKYY